MNKNRRDEFAGKFMVTPKKPTEEQMAYIESYFDAQTDKEVRTMQSIEETQRILKKYLLARIIVFPLHWLALRILLGRKDASHLSRLTKTFYTIIRTPILDEETILKFMDYAI